MKKTFLSGLLIASLTLAGCASQETNSSSSEQGNETQTQAQEKNSIDLSGVWTHSNSTKDEPALEARIDGDTIEVKWVFGEALGDGLFWAGSFDSQVPAKGETTITSTRDKLATENSLMASTDDTKEFTYTKDKLKFPVTFDDENFEVEMEKTGELDEGETISSSTDGYSFADGVLTSPKVTIRITDMRVIPAGDVGNEFGTTDIIAFYYDITNNSDAEVTPLDWIIYFEAVQDNDPNKVNELEVASHPDAELMGDQLSIIKKGGTLKGAIAYELTDNTTPVELIASGQYGMEELGRQTFEIQ